MKSKYQVLSTDYEVLSAKYRVISDQSAITDGSVLRTSSFLRLRWFADDFHFHRPLPIVRDNAVR
jgi:hypothetical protein